MRPSVIFSFVACLLVWGCVGLYFGHRDEIRHVEYLKAYIKANQLPVPAYPPQDGDIKFLIEVPCQ